MSRRLLILITGMAGSGKTTLSGIIRGKGFRVIKMGDVIRELANQKGIDSTPENIGKLASEIRKEGPDAVARLSLEILSRMHEKIIIIDGVRSLAEVEAFKEAFNVILLAIYASPLSRFKRLTRRGRSDDPKTWEEFKARDQRELGFGIGDAVATADYLIINDDGRDQLKQEFESLMEKIGYG